MARAHVHPAMAVAVVAVEAVVAEVEMAGAGDDVARPGDPRLERRERHDHLEGRPRRIEPVGRLVDQRRGARRRPLPPLRRADAGIEDVRVEGRLGGHGQHLAVAGVEQDGGGAFLDLAADRLLQLGIDADLDVLAGDALAAVELADDAADGVHLDLHGTGASAQDAVVVPLDPGAADADAGQLHQRVVAGIGFRRRGDVADDMRQVLGLGVDAGGAHVDRDAGQVGRVDLDPRHFLPGQEFAQDDGDEAAVAAHLALDPRLFVVAERDDPREGLERRAEVGGLLGHQQGAPVQPVARDHLAVAVQHAPARRRRTAGR